MPRPDGETRRDLDQPVGRGDGYLPQHQRVDQAEDRGVGANSEGERQRGHRRVAGRLPHRPQRIADVAAEVLDPTDPPGVAALLLDQRHVAELAEGSRARIRGREAGGEIELDLPLEMVAQLGVELLLDASRRATASAPEAATS